MFNDYSFKIEHEFLCFKLPVRRGPLTAQTRLVVEQSKKCLVSVSKHRSAQVVGGLIKMLQTLNSMRTCSETDLVESQCIILTTLEQCFSDVRSIVFTETKEIPHFSMNLKLKRS